MKLNALLLQYALLFLWINPIVGKLCLISPTEFKKRFNDANGNQGCMDYKLVNIGKLQYGSEMVLKFENPFPDKSGCKNPVISTESTNNVQMVTLVTEGGCSLSTKASMASSFGINVLIVSSDFEQIVLEDEIKSTILYINSTDSAAIWSSYEMNPDSLYLYVAIEIENASNNPNWDILLTPIDIKVYSFIYKNYENKEFYDLIQNFPNFEPHFMSVKEPGLKANEFNIDYENCYGNGRYCSIDPDGDGPLTGKHMLDESIRQKCIWKSNSTIVAMNVEINSWWIYSAKWLFCIMGVLDKGIDGCSSNIIENLNLNATKISECYENSFSNYSEKNSSKNYILEEEQEFIIYLSPKSYSAGFISLPLLYINNIVYQGALSDSELGDALCTSLSDENDFCQKRENCKLCNKKGVSNKLLGCITLLVIILVILLVVFLLKKVRKDNNTLMDAEFQQVVSKYSNLSHSVSMSLKNQIIG